MLVANDWTEYEIIDTGGGEKLERWKDIILRRPDPQIIWPLKRETEEWKRADARYYRSSSGGGRWEFAKKLPERWTLNYDNKLSFYIRPTNFKHTGLFPEQAANWKWIIEKIQAADRPVKILNLFAYTGGATVAAAYAGAEVCHVDAAKGMVQWAKENVELSGLGKRKVRFITDDVFKFVQREIRRGSKYDGIIMDPPSYGRGPGGEMWKLEDSLYPFIETCTKVLSDQPLFFLINSYTAGLSPTVLKNIMIRTLADAYRGSISSGELGLPVTKSGFILPAGILARWEA
ncbi:class I SAM-dependent methyltransferase [Ferviditalea candida]|uniref:Class I SAM-dependent methyltransferase n=1 Tax=Ferviditalea candida TaxID=3108399 RepID=A0ABU5ZFS0_9BACL|nr:class I SAM-dependent methyltransferase [Paenibacillaceae bacterium T2]